MGPVNLYDDTCLHKQQWNEKKRKGKIEEKWRGKERETKRDLLRESGMLCKFKGRSVSVSGHQNEFFSLEVSWGVEWLGMWRLWTAGKVLYATVLTPRI